MKNYRNNYRKLPNKNNLLKNKYKIEILNSKILNHKYLNSNQH
jgi:hypothetical protein